MAKEYLNNKEFERIILRFCDIKNNNNQNDFREAQVELAKAFYTLAENIIRAFKFQMVDKDEALQEGVMICFEKIHKFDPAIGKAFAFCTAIILNHYKQLYRSAKSYNEFKIKYHQYLYNKSENHVRYKNKKVKFTNFGNNDLFGEVN